jgi:hypothetical protein
MPPKLRKSHVDLSSDDGASQQQQQQQQIGRKHSPGQQEVDNDDDDDECIRNFIQITGATRDLAKHYLEVSRSRSFSPIGDYL